MFNKWSVYVQDKSFIHKNLLKLFLTTVLINILHILNISIRLLFDFESSVWDFSNLVRYIVIVHHFFTEFSTMVVFLYFLIRGLYVLIKQKRANKIIFFIEHIIVSITIMVGAYYIFFISSWILAGPIA